MRRTLLDADWTVSRLSHSARLTPEQVADLTSGDAVDIVRETYDVASMPAMVHTILEDAGRIETPWKGRAAADCLWVAESDWLYRVQFPGDPEHDFADGSAQDSARISASGRVFLTFGGIDTIVDLYLNGELIGSYQSMYRAIRCDVTHVVSPTNVLLVHVRSVFRIDGDERVIVRFADDDPERPVRRSRHNYGSYLGPNPLFSRVGVFGEVAIEYEGAGAIQTAAALADVAADLQTGNVSVRAAGVAWQPAELQVDLRDPHGTLLASSSVLVEGEYAVSPRLGIDAPLLWWPIGYGEQPLYTLVVTLHIGDTVHDVARRCIGFRHIAMDAPLHFRVNGVPIRLWGANWVAPHWVTAVWDDRKARRLFGLAANAHMRCLRVWGEVESPDDRFYQMADERGFLVWQDFTDLGLEPTETNGRLARSEVSATVDRLGHHPSIFLWCGDNELPMWHVFGERDGQFPGRRIIEEVVPDVLRGLDPERPYLPSTPYHGYDPNDPAEYDTHGYTNVSFVHGFDYLNFASEDTRIAAAEVRSLELFMAPEDLWPANYSPCRVPGELLPWPKSWMAYTSTKSERKTGPLEQFYEGTNPESLVYRIGMAAGMYHAETIERQRRGRPVSDASGERRCGGYLIWKLHDSWPQIYSAKIDYFLEPLIPYYLIRRAFSPVLVSIEIGTYIHIWVVNDTPSALEGTLTAWTVDIEAGRSRHCTGRVIQIGPGGSEPVLNLREWGTIDRRQAIVAQFESTDGMIEEYAIRYLDIERNLPFPAAELSVTSIDGVLEITTDRLARSIVLEGDSDGDRFGWGFQDNYFDLVPGITTRVRVLGRHNHGSITARPFYSPHGTTVDYRAVGDSDEE